MGKFGFGYLLLLTIIACGPSLEAHQDNNSLKTEVKPQAKATTTEKLERNSVVNRHCVDLRFCYESLNSILRKHIRISIDLHDKGELAGVRNTLVQGLEKAAKYLTDNEKYRPLSLDAIKRGLDFNNAFGKVCVEGDIPCKDTENLTTSRFLGMYYEHILTRIIPLDNNYYIPYSYDRRHRSDYQEVYDCDWWKKFSIEYFTAAKELLKLISGKSIDATVPYSLQNDRYELGVYVIAFEAIGDDLSRDEFNRDSDYPIDQLFTEAAYIHDALSEASNERRLSRVVLYSRNFSEYIIGALDSYRNSYAQESMPNYSCNYRRGVRP